MRAKESKVSFKGILFNRRRVRNEIKWKLENIMMVYVWYFHFSVMHKVPCIQFVIVEKKYIAANEIQFHEN